MKRLLAAAVLLTAACTGVPSSSREMPDNCDYPGASVQCRGLHPG